MKLTSKGPYSKGYNALVSEETDTGMNMDFGVLAMDAGDSETFSPDKEAIYVLQHGKVRFAWDGNEETAERDSCFHNDPVLLHVPAGTEVRVTCQQDGTEVSIHRAANPRRFAARLMRSGDCLTPSEQRGAGTLNEASTRIVRTFLDRSNCPETNFFIGEVVSFPGKWSSFPPHTHVEPEIYYYKFLPENGYGFAEHGDEVYKVRHNDLTGMADGVTHSQATAPGYAQYYLWVIRLRDDANIVTTVVPEHEWTTGAGAKYFPEI